MTCLRVSGFLWVSCVSPDILALKQVDFNVCSVLDTMTCKWLFFYASISPSPVCKIEIYQVFILKS